MNTPQSLTQNQTRIINDLLTRVAPDMATTITAMLTQQLQSHGLRDPVGYVRSCVLAARAGRHGPNRGLHIPRARTAGSGDYRQLRDSKSDTQDR